MSKRHVMDIVLLILGVAIFIFTVTMVVLFCVFQSVPDTLITSFFTCVGSEGGFMAVIAVAKKIKENKADDYYLDEETDNFFERGNKHG